MLNQILDTFKVSKLTKNCISVSLLGVVLIKNFLKFWCGLILIGLTVISAVEFVGGTALVNTINSWNRLMDGLIHPMSFVVNLSYLILGVGFTLIIAGIGVRVFWGFWRLK